MLNWCTILKAGLSLQVSITVLTSSEQ